MERLIYEHDGHRYEVTPKGRELMRRLNVTTPLELMAACILIEAHAEDLGMSHGDAELAYTDLVETGLIRWDAERWGYALVDGAGDEAGFIEAPDLQVLEAA